MAVANESVRFDEALPRPPDVLRIAKRLRKAQEDMGELLNRLKRDGFLDNLPPKCRCEIEQLAAETAELNIELVWLLFAEHLERNYAYIDKLLLAEAEEILRYGKCKPQTQT